MYSVWPLHIYMYMCVFTVYYVDTTTTPCSRVQIIVSYRFSPAYQAALHCINHILFCRGPDQKTFTEMSGIFCYQERRKKKWEAATVFKYQSAVYWKMLLWWKRSVRDAPVKRVLSKGSIKTKSSTLKKKKARRKKSHPCLPFLPVQKLASCAWKRFQSVCFESQFLQLGLRALTRRGAEAAFAAGGECLRVTSCLTDRRAPQRGNQTH